MRNYGTIAPSFWTGETGRFLRTQGVEAQLLAAYVMTAPSANIIGLYYLPLPVICHETGMSPEGALKALRSLSEGEFAFYDEHTSEVWVPEMAHYQTGASMSAKDNRHKAVVREMMNYAKSKFLIEFHARYAGPYNLPAWIPLEAPSKPLRSHCQKHCQKQNQNKGETPLPPSDPAKPEKPKRSKPDSVTMPPALSASDAFLSAWTKWLAFRRQMKKPLTISGQQTQLNKFAEWGPDRAVAAIEWTIFKGYQGLVEPESQRPAQAGKKTYDPMARFREPTQ